jgi:glutathione S-transferase
MLTIHHLGVSQSERVVWLCEELDLKYELKRYERRADNRLAPEAYKALHPMGVAPVITDGAVVLAESGRDLRLHQCPVWPRPTGARAF